MFVVKGMTAEFIGEAQDDPYAVKRVLNGDVQLVFIWSSISSKSCSTSEPTSAIL